VRNWQDGAPAGLSQTNYWASRFTGALSVAAPGNYSFLIYADDAWSFAVGGQVSALQFVPCACQAC